VLEMTKLSRKEQKLKLESLLDEFHLHHVRKSAGDVLSGGERRRTEIARALAVDPKFILLDEPFAGIDPIAVEDIQAIVARLKYRNIGILITDHNVTETLSICDRAYLLIEGKIFKHGSAEELAADDEVKKLYLGRNFELKRKDYLYDDLNEPKTPTLENVIRSLESWRVQIISLENDEAYRAEEFQVDSAGSANGGESMDEFDKGFAETLDVVQTFVRGENHQELTAEVNDIFQGDYNRLGLIDALLNSFKTYQLQTASNYN